ncbi:BRCT domain-containing protein, partial [Basidiobolus meristosporus CBS 931.73]
MSRLRPNVNSNTMLYDDNSFLQRKPFEDYIICCTGLSVATKQALYSQVEELGGRIQPDFTNNVTHLIADKVGSEKYKARELIEARQINITNNQAALRCKVPILTPLWAEQCYEYFKNNENFEPNTISKLHTLLPLTGCCICVTGLSGEEREAVEKLTVENGGEYSPALTMPCTHLIVKISFCLMVTLFVFVKERTSLTHANVPEGRKYQAAVKRNLHIVSLDWLYECANRKVCVSEHLYPALANPDSVST